MAEWIRTASIAIFVAGITAWLTYLFAIKKMRKERESKARETRLQGAIKVHQYIQETLRDLNELPGDNSLSTPEKHGEILKRFDTRLDLFKTEGRLYFPEQLGERIHKSLGECRMAAQRFDSHDSGYANAVMQMMKIDTEIRSYIDTLSDKL